jgi:hypothetical protein
MLPLFMESRVISVKHPIMEDHFETINYCGDDNIFESKEKLNKLVLIDDRAL